MKIRPIILIVAFSILSSNLYAREFHVSVKGNDQNNGTESRPFKTIMAAASKAMPGDITVLVLFLFSHNCRLGEMAYVTHTYK